MNWGSDDLRSHDSALIDVIYIHPFDELYITQTSVIWTLCYED